VEKEMNTDTHKETIDTGLEDLAEAFIAAKDWSEKNNRSKVHIVKTHYKDLQDGIWKDAWNLEWENDQDRIDWGDYNLANL
jgi:hypothetical protein